jgi:hypothetical protein
MGESAAAFFNAPEGYTMTIERPTFPQPADQSPSQIGRRGLLCGVAATSAAAALAAATPPAAATGSPDPIFAAIEAHRRAAQKSEEAVGRQYALETKLVSELKGDPDRFTIAHNDPAYIEAEQTVSTASDEMFDRSLDLLDANPTSVAGAAALLRYVSSEDLGDDWRFPDFEVEDDGDDEQKKTDFRTAVMRHVSAALDGLLTHNAGVLS